MVRIFVACRRLEGERYIRELYPHFPLQVGGERNVYLLWPVRVPLLHFSVVLEWVTNTVSSL